MNAPAVPDVAAAREPVQAIAAFAAMLRDHGLRVGVSEQQAMITAALGLPVCDTRRLGDAWRAIACHSRSDWRQWTELFERFWFPHRLKGNVRVSGQTRPSRSLQQMVAQMHASMDAASAPPARRDGAAPLVPAGDAPQADLSSDAGHQQAQGGASRTDPLHDRSLSQWLPHELSGLQQLADRIAARLRQRLTRRWASHASGARLDMRATLRRSVATGGLPVQASWRRQRRQQPRLFLLVDVSRSMETHAQLFLRIARAFVHAARARVFVFHTRLAEVTPLLSRDSGQVQDKVNAVTAGFGGGTRIATSVEDFVSVHARAQLQRNSRVWILSDGFDADPPDALQRALGAVRARGAVITWFHPTRQPPASESMMRCRGDIARFVALATLRDLAAAEHVLR